ncbi:hypothetical protein CCR85_00500 [Rhodothalassium salexigens]|nr:hypothetical protein [Rhodothalassium salexigens]MBK5921619.1 hypothetical protein [Rhodothalassium salexigens]
MTDLVSYRDISFLYIIRLSRVGGAVVRLLAVLTLWAVACPGLAAEDPASRALAQVPMRSVGGALIVDVRVGEAGRFAFRLDTAAHQTAIYRRLVGRLGLGRSASGPVMVLGTGGRRLVPRYRLGRLGIGGVEHRLDSVAALPVSADPGEPLYGVLGQDFLLRYAVELDGPGRCLRLYARRSGVPGAPGAVYDDHPLHAVTGRLVSVRARLGGTRVRALVDTGAARSVLNPAAAQALTLAPGRAARVTGIDGTATSVTVADDALTVHLGDRALGQTRPAVGALPIFRSLGLTDTPAMILGTDLLAAHTIIFDWQTMRLRWRRPSPR